MIKQWSEKLLIFAVRLYTRLHDKGESKFGAFGPVLEDDALWIDNGKRGIKITLLYGPKWAEENEDGI